MFLELLPDIFLGELARQALQKLNSPLHGEIRLRSQRHHALGKMLVIFGQQPEGDHEEVNVVKQDCSLFAVGFALLQKGDGMLAPMPKRIEMVRGVIAIVEAEAVALQAYG